MKRIVTMMVIFMATMFSSISTNAAKRDTESFRITTTNEYVYELGSDSDFHYGLITDFTIVDDDDNVTRTVSTMDLSKAYAKYYGLTSKPMFTVVGPMIFKEKIGGKDIGIQFYYISYEHGMVKLNHELVLMSEFTDEDISAEVISYL